MFGVYKLKLKNFFAIILSFAICTVFCGCKKEETGKLKFTASCYPMYIIALNLTDGVSGVEVSNMSEKHKGCLHDFQIQSDDFKKIEKSNALIINGAGMESFLDKITKELPEINIIDSSLTIDFIKDDGCNCEEEHCHHEYNPHIWVSISNYIVQVKNIANGLCEADPVHSNEYRKNETAYIKKLEDLKSKMHLELSSIKRKDIITFHEAFPYFAKEFGLNIAAVINREPESDPDAKELSETIEIIKKSGITTLFTEPQYPCTAAEVIAKESGAKIYTLDPAATGDNSKDSYINTMEKNLETLKIALG